MMASPCDSGDLLLPLCSTAILFPSSAFPLPSQTVATRSSLPEASPSIIADFGSGGSGIEPTSAIAASPSPTPVPMPMAVIVFTLNLTVEAFGDLEENFTAVVIEVLAEEANLSADLLVISIDLERSTNRTTVVSLYVLSETGGADDQATVEAFMALESSSNSAWLTLQEELGVELELQQTTPSPTPPIFPPNLDLPWWHWTIIGISGGIAVSAILFFCCTCCRWYSVTHKRKRERRHERSYWEEESRDLELVRTPQQEQLVKKITRISFKSRGQVRSQPLTVSELERVVTNTGALHAEYASLPSNMVTMAEVPPGAEEKNRYKDVLPNPHSRVALFLKFGVPNSDYINANYIRGYRDASKAYIATQGPLYWTVADFWRMVWEQKCSVIVMATKLEERGIVKCARYWPDERVALSSTYDELEVIMKRRLANQDYTTTTFHLRHKEKMVSREVTHFWFASWPDHGVPVSTKPVLDFLLHARKYIRDMPGPAVIHCSAGIGRSGVFIGADIGMQQLEEGGEVDVARIVSTMRQDRGGMVQTKDQYVFLHQLLFDYSRYLEHLRSPYQAAPARLATTPEAEEESDGSESSQELLISS